MQIQIKKTLAEQCSPQTVKAPMQIWLIFKLSELKVSLHVAFTFGNYDDFKVGWTRCNHYKILKFRIQTIEH